MTCLVTLALGLFAALPAAGQDEPAPAGDDLQAFRYVADQQPVGRVLHYRHSNVDGTRASRVTLYVAAEDRIEALKWNPGWTRSTLVVAEMDWKTFSVRSFETTVITTGNERQVLGRLEVDADGRSLETRFGGARTRVAVEQRPWHSYDFDLASLNVSMRYLVDPEGRVMLGIMDAVGGAFGHRGWVELGYEADEERAGIPCRRYALDGPGFSDRGGLLWVSRDEEACFVDFEFDLPDEPGMTSGKLLLLERGELTGEEWEAFVAESAG